MNNEELLYQLIQSCDESSLLVAQDLAMELGCGLLILQLYTIPMEVARVGIRETAGAVYTTILIDHKIRALVGNRDYSFAFIGYKNGLGSLMR